ncbi:MAG: hypothetical protein ABI193_18200 [Minicystis sp.]
MAKRTILRKGSPGGALFLYCHFDRAMVESTLFARRDDTVVIERWGEGTATYRPLLESYGGFSAWVEAIAEEAEIEGFSRVCLVTWSAGSQVAKSVCQGEAWPDAILMMDGLYGDKPPGARPGDGKVNFDESLQAIARYALSAAQGERTMALVHSRIPTSYASSCECVEAVRCWVEDTLGEPLAPDESADATRLGKYERAVAREGLHVVGFPGTGPLEHVREGRLHAACRDLWVR